MSNYHVEPIDKPQALTKEAIKSLRKQQVQGLSRRQLMRAAIGTGIGLWLLEVTAGTIGFIWPNLKGGFGAPIAIGDLDTVKLQNSSLPIEEGFPAYYSEARAFVILYDPGQQRFLAGRGHDRRRRGAQRPGALPALPAPRLQAQPVPQELLVRVPVPRLALRPARDQGRRRRSSARRRASMDRFSITVDGSGVLTINTGKITLGPLPVALGQPGLIPPRTPTGCI